MKRILDIVDMQKDFMLPGYRLTVAGAEKIIAPTNEFLRTLPAGVFDYALIKYDTHFEAEYKKSPEHLDFNFPLHCEYNTDGWSLAIDEKLLDDKTKKLYLAKNEFDMWADGFEAKLQKDDFKSEEEAKAYANLMFFCEDKDCQKPVITRDEFFKFHFPDAKNVQICLIGVTSDFCDKFAIAGYLKRGYNVCVLTDLTKGINTEMEQVVAENFAPYLQSGQLSLVRSVDFLHPFNLQQKINPNQKERE